MEYKDVEKILFTKERIKIKVKEIAEQINADYINKDNVLVIGILSGAVVFYADLVRELEFNAQFDFMCLSSYGNSDKSCGKITVKKDLSVDVKGKDLLIVEDIVDTGRTLFSLKQNLMERGAKSVKICALLDKPSRRACDIRADYVGFEIEDNFVVGYGLDYAEKYRNYADICVLKPSAYQN